MLPNLHAHNDARPITTIPNCLRLLECACWLREAPRPKVSILGNIADELISNIALRIIFVPRETCCAKRNRKKYTPTVVAVRVHCRGLLRPIAKVLFDK